MTICHLTNYRVKHAERGDARVAFANLLTLWDAARIVAEPGGATALAALLSGAYVPAPRERVAAIVCGGNTTAVSF